jgi:RNA polymerase sigma-70 factor (sigma-E family)
MPVVVAPEGDVDRDAEFEAFMTQAEPLLGRTAYLLTGDRHRAEELVQQALVRTYVAWPRAPARDPLAYARKVLANARIDTWRKHRREVLLAADDLPDGRQAGPDDAHADRDLLVRALARLPERRRRVVVLRYLVDLGEREVAEDLGITVGAVKSAASRGLAQLRGELAGSSVPAVGTEVSR